MNLALLDTFEYEFSPNIKDNCHALVLLFKPLYTKDKYDKMSFIRKARVGMT